MAHRNCLRHLSCWRCQKLVCPNGSSVDPATAKDGRRSGTRRWRDRCTSPEVDVRYASPRVCASQVSGPFLSGRGRSDRKQTNDFVTVHRGVHDSNARHQTNGQGTGDRNRQWLSGRNSVPLGERSLLDRDRGTARQTRGEGIEAIGIPKRVHQNW